MSRNLGCDSKFMDSKLEYFLNYLSFYNVSKTSKQNHGWLKQVKTDIEVSTL